MTEDVAVSSLYHQVAVELDVKNESLQHCVNDLKHTVNTHTVSLTSELQVNDKCCYCYSHYFCFFSSCIIVSLKVNLCGTGEVLRSCYPKH